MGQWSWTSSTVTAIDATAQMLACSLGIRWLLLSSWPSKMGILCQDRFPVKGQSVQGCNFRPHRCSWIQSPTNVFYISSYSKLSPAQLDAGNASYWLIMQVPTRKLKCLFWLPLNSIIMLLKNFTAEILIFRNCMQTPSINQLLQSLIQVLCHRLFMQTPF